MGQEWATEVGRRRLKAVIATVVRGMKQHSTVESVRGLGRSHELGVKTVVTAHGASPGFSWIPKSCFMDFSFTFSFSVVVIMNKE